MLEGVRGEHFTLHTREIRMIKRCQNEECGKSFTPARRDAKFCSDRCRGQANARRTREATTPRPAANVSALAASDARLEAIEARLESAARVMETRLDALERAMKATWTDTSQALKAATEEQGRARDTAHKSVRDLGRRLDGLESDVAEMKASRGAMRELRQINERLTALETRLNEVVMVVNNQHGLIQQLDTLVGDLIDPPDEPKRGRR
jgi:chromosome segregation ATPase